MHSSQAISASADTPSRPRGRVLLGCAAGVVLLVFAASGCASSSRPLDAFRQNVTHYVAAGGGDPNCLRDTLDLRSRRSFRPGQIRVGAIQNARSRDAVGVLVGVHEVASRPWYVFLVGVTEVHSRRGATIESIRPLAFTADADGLHWVSGEPEQSGTAKYLASTSASDGSVALTADRAPAARGRRTPNQPFPASTDVFVLDRTSEGEVLIREKRSGAAWRLGLPKVLPPPTD